MHAVGHHTPAASVLPGDSHDDRAHELGGLPVAAVIESTRGRDPVTACCQTMMTWTTSYSECIRSAASIVQASDDGHLAHRVLVLGDFAAVVVRAVAGRCVALDRV